MVNVSYMETRVNTTTPVYSSREVRDSKLNKIILNLLQINVFMHFFAQL